MNWFRNRRARISLEHLEDRAVPTAFVVDTLLDEVNPADGLTSLREAISDANGDAHDLITFAPGLTGTIFLSIPGKGDDLNLTGDLDILRSVSIIGPGADKLMVNAVGEDRVFDVPAAKGTAVILSGLTIAGGEADSGGGVHTNTGADLTLMGVEVIGNHANGNFGGGVFNNSGALTVINSTIAENLSLGQGGGIFVSHGTLNLNNSTVSGNEVTDTGGGIEAFDETVMIRNSTITSDRATSGGGLLLDASTVTLTSTIVARNADTNGFPNVDGAVQAASANNLIGDGTGLTGISNGVNRNLIGTAAHPIDPLLGPLQFNGGPTRTHALLASSPAIDHGSNPGGFATDQRGAPFARLVGAGVDIGAFEFEPPAVQPPLPPSGPSPQALAAAMNFLTEFKSAGSPAGFAIGDAAGDGTADIVMAFRLKSGKLAIITFGGTDGHIAGLFFPFQGPLARSSRVRIVLVNLNASPAKGIGLVVSGGGPGVPHVSIFKPDGARVL
jgi:hypothetical protein